jgi:methylmalonyl-CoA mutase C-terminal domain/subunit
LRARGLDDVLVFGGGIIPPDDLADLDAAGVARVFTPGSGLDDITGWLEQALDERRSQTAGA